MNLLIFSFVLSGCFLSAKAHVIKVVILAVLGLAGLWLVHLLAQDYQQIQRPTKKWLFKRSINFEHADLSDKWSTIWAKDPIGCARSFICQLATNEIPLDSYSVSILNLARATQSNISWATNELENAVSLGTITRSGKECMKTYTLCPFSLETMLKILNLFRNST